MTLIILLMVLVTERIGLQGEAWRAERYLSWYISNGARALLRKADDTLTLFIFVAIPALVFGLVLMLLDSDFLNFVVSLLVLAVCVGNGKVRTYYRQYLNAKSRKDQQAAQILQMKLSTPESSESDFFQDEHQDLEHPVADQASSESEDTVSDADKAQAANDEASAKHIEEESSESRTTDNRAPSGYSIGEILVWNNFKYYAAPIFYYVIFGVPGVVFYSTLLYVTESRLINKHLDDYEMLKDIRNTLATWLEWAYWVPSRLVTVGYMFVGHFSQGLEAWLRYGADTKSSSQTMICKVALAAEAHPEDDNAKHMVKLAKRNMVFFLVIVALLTLYGQII